MDSPKEGQKTETFVPEFQKLKLRPVPKVKRRAPQPPTTLPLRNVKIFPKIYYY